MGEHRISHAPTDAQMRAFTKSLLEDLQAMEHMLEQGLFERDVRRIGAEQEIFLVNQAMRPVPIATQMLEGLSPDHFTGELALFNLEANLSPQVLGGKCLSAMEDELLGFISQARTEARRAQAEILLTGILPTLEKSDLSLDNMLPSPRYHAMNQAMSLLRNGDFQTYIKGLDELQVHHDNVMLESCNTSFQVHFQVSGEEFARFYNLAQAVTAPVLAAAVNSPVFLQHRLWHETRVALFQQSLDARSKVHQARGTRTRVSFGDAWVEDSVLEIYREDVARFRSLLSVDTGESSLAILERGEIPPLKALCLHNGTVYRWNRACYGGSGEKPHLRIENRVLPAGPTVIDQMANAAFFFGLMSAMAEEYRDVTRVMAFDDAKANFMAAARYGLSAQFKWVRGRAVTAEKLILEHLLPLARAGLKSAEIDSEDVDRYLGVIEERVRLGRTGAQWMLDSLASMGSKGTRYERYRSLTAAIASRQEEGLPVHTWELADLSESPQWNESYRNVGKVMTTDLFTVQPEDLVDLAASLMDWEHVKHVPVEDHEGRLVGLVSHRALLRMVSKGLANRKAEPVAVREIMKTDPICVTPETTTLVAIETMRKRGVSCLPVVDGDRKLVGIVTENDFIVVAAALLEEKLREN